MRKLVAALLIAAMLVTAGCAGSPQEDGATPDAPQKDTIHGYQVVDVEGETFVCFESSYGEGFDCEPLNSSDAGDF